MVFLVFSILSSTAIALIFKHIDNKKVRTFDAIVINYFIAATIGFLINRVEINPFTIYQEKWFPLAITIGVLFIVMFYLIEKSNQKAGITVTTVAMRMAVVIPMLFSIIYYQEEVTSVKVAGTILAVVAVSLSVYKKRDEKKETTSPSSSNRRERQKTNPRPGQRRK